MQELLDNEKLFVQGGSNSDTNFGLGCCLCCSTCVVLPIVAVVSYWIGWVKGLEECEKHHCVIETNSDQTQ